MTQGDTPASPAKAAAAGFGHEPTLLSGCEGADL